jgi:hypothetical protein
MSYDLQATSYKLGGYKLQITSHEPQVTSYMTRDMSYKLRYTRYEIAPALAEDSLVQHLDCSMTVWLYANLHRTLIELSW